MNNWRGYLMKAMNSGTVFPTEYIALESWQATPDRREELLAYRDDNSRKLHRITAEGKKSTFSFETMSSLSLSQKNEILHFFTDNETDTDQRKIYLEYWNDDRSEYKTGYFYRPNMQFKIIKITDTDIWYDKMLIELIEY